MAFNWKCPHCNITQTVVDQRIHHFKQHLQVGDVFIENPAYEIHAIGCSNKECKKVQITLGFGKAHYANGTSTTGNIKHEFYKRITPSDAGKPQPDYIPLAIRQDYYEACQISSLSPKASATLARRCLQGVIRDFCGISKTRLIDEISSLREAVDQGKAPLGVTPDTVDALDHVRSIGNIGAHMEKDINIIIDVEPDEALILIELIESLFDEWYVARERRSKRFEVLSNIASAKKTAQESGRIASAGSSA
jgi:hypothetical protein